MKKDQLYKIFQKYLTDIFFETGTHLGQSVERAVNIGYKEIHSIEIIKDRYDECFEKFKNNENVFLYLGDSLIWIPEILNTIDCRCTFWLDAHMSQVSRNCPTLEELKLIGQHHIKDHIILIDDMRDFGTQAHEFIKIDDLKQQILAINPSYKFSFQSTSIPNNVLVCKT